MLPDSEEAMDEAKVAYGDPAEFFQASVQDRNGKFIYWWTDLSRPYDETAIRTQAYQAPDND